MTKITLRSYNREIEAITDQGKIDIAIAHCLHILKFFPKHVETYRLLGKAYLENQRLGDAADVFQRVLSAVPDDFVSHIGMSIIREDEGNLDAAIWHMQRAYDVQSANITIQDELRRLYDRRDGIEPPKIRLTRAALARMYARGDLVAEAIAELRSALQEEPDRTDLLVLLARMYFVNQQRVKCIQTCSQVLNKLPYCLEANLTISQALQDTNRAEEAEPYLERAQELDPYSAFISENAPRLELVPDQAVTLLKLDEADIRTTAAAASQPAWVTSLGEEMGSGEETEASIDWLLDESESGAAEVEMDDFSDEPDLAASLAASAAFGGAISLVPEAEEPEALPPQKAEEIDLADIEPETEDAVPDWMEAAGWEPAVAQPTETSAAPAESELEEMEPDQTEPVPPPPAIAPTASSLEGAVDDSGLYRADIPEWLQAMAPSDLTDETSPNLVPQEEITEPDLLAPETPADQAPIPDWLQELEIDEALTGTSGPAPTGDIPDWLQEFDGDETVMETGAAPTTDDIPDWLQDSEIESDDLDLPASTTAVSTTDEIPDWLREMETESDEPATAPGEEVPDRLSNLAAEEEAEGVGEAFEAEEAVPDWLLSLETPESEAAAEPEAAAEFDPESDEVPDWLLEMAEKAETAATSADDPSDRTGVTLWLERNARLEAEGEEIEQEFADDEPEAVAAAEEMGDEIPEEVELAAAAASLTDDDTTGQSEIPAWLQDLDAELLSEPDAEMSEAAEMEESELEPAAQMEAAMMEEPQEEPAEEGATEEASFEFEMGDDDALRWLESLAAKQGAKEEELLTSPDERMDAPPEWVQTMAADYAEEAKGTGDETVMADAEEAEPALEATQLEDIAPAAETDSLDWDEFEKEAEALPELDPAVAASAAMAWMPELEAEEEDSEEVFLAQPEEPVEDAPAWSLEAQGDEELPAWLQEESAEESGAEAEEAELPAWLRDIDIEEETEEPASAVPDWLQETMITSSPLQEASEVEAETPESEAPETAGAPEEVYAWSQDETAAEAEEMMAEAEAEAADESKWWDKDTGTHDRPDFPTEESTEEPEEEPVQEMAEEMAVETFIETPAETLEPAAPDLSKAEKMATILNDARATLGSGEKEAAIAHYQHLIKKKAHLAEVIDDLKEALQYNHPVDIDVWATLGDAYAKNHNLQDALDAYTKAEELLR